MSGLAVITLAPACPFSNTREIHLLACYKSAYRTRRQLMHNRRCARREVFDSLKDALLDCGRSTGKPEVSLEQGRNVRIGDEPTAAVKTSSILSWKSDSVWVLKNSKSQKRGTNLGIENV
jgi:hypothetical protein